MKRGILKRCFYSAFVGLTIFFTVPTPDANAADTYWICTSSQWDNGSCWDNGTVPQAGYAVIVNAPGAVITYVNQVNPLLEYLDVDSNGVSNNIRIRLRQIT